MGNRRELADPVSEVEDVRTILECGDDGLDPRRHRRTAGFEQQRIEIALYRHSGRQAGMGPGGIERLVEACRAELDQFARTDRVAGDR